MAPALHTIAIGVRCALAVAVPLAGACARPARTAERGVPATVRPGPTASAAGPRALRAPEGAVFAETSEQLRALLRDERGPAEIWLRSRRYDGDFTVTRTVALRGERGAVLSGTGTGTVLRIEADGVTVDNLIVRRSGRSYTAEDAGIEARGKAIGIMHVRVEDALFGVALGPCPGCRVEHVHVRGPGDAEPLKGDGIKLWESHDAVVSGCLVEGVRDVVVWYSRRVVLDGNTVRRSRYGSHFMYAHDSVVRGSRVENNVVGIFVMYSARLRVLHNVLAGARGAAGIGLGFKDSDAVEVTGNWLVANTTGTYLDGTPRDAGQPVRFSGNMLALNDVALRLHGRSDGLHVTGNEFVRNATLAEVEGGGDALAARFHRNHYSEYAGYDLDRDGFGDVAFQVKRLSGDMVDAHPSLALFRGTVGLGLIDVLASAMPVFASRVLLQDEQPQMLARRTP